MQNSIIAVLLLYWISQYSIFTILLSTLSENFEYPSKMFEEWKKNTLLQLKKFERLYSIILQMTCWLWAWADSFSSTSNFFFIFSQHKHSCFNQIMKIYLITTFLNVYVLVVYKKKREKSTMIFFISKDYMNWLFSFSLYYSPKYLIILELFRYAILCIILFQKKC